MREQTVSRQRNVLFFFFNEKKNELNTQLLIPQKTEVQFSLQKHRIALPFIVCCIQNSQCTGKISISMCKTLELF